jgi:hypothetical protein
VPKETRRIVSGVAQANTGQTTVFDVPRWSRSAIFYLNVVAATGTTPLTDFKFRYVIPKITGAPVVATSQSGPRNEVQTIDLGDFGAGDTTKFTHATVETTGTLAFDTLDAGGTAAARAAIVKGVLDELASLPAEAMTVAEVTENLVYSVTFGGTLARTDVSAITITTPVGFTPTGVTETTKGVVSTQDEAQTITLTGGPTDGTFTVTWTGVGADINVTTPPIPATATATEVKDALKAALGAAGTGGYQGSDIVDVRTGAGTSGDPFVHTLTFSGPTTRDLNVDAVTVDGSKLFTNTAGTTTDFGGWDGITQIAGTTAAEVEIIVGPDESDTTDDTGAVYQVQHVLPDKMAAVITLDRTTGNELYTYSLYVSFV